MLALLLLALLPSGSRAYQRPGRTERVSISASGAQGDADSGTGLWTAPAISAEGRHVAFVSSASTFVPDDGFDLDVFVHDRLLGTTELVSRASDGTQANAPSDQPAISGDGRYVAFMSYATNLSPGDPPTTPNVFVHDRATGQTRIVEPGANPSITPDGRYVAFQQYPGGAGHVRVWDSVNDTVVTASLTSEGALANASASEPSISADGRYVVFRTAATNLDVRDTEVEADVYVHDMVTGRTDLVSISTEGQEANDEATKPVISGDGRFVAFWSRSTNLVPNQAQDHQIFVHDMHRKITERVSVGTDGREPGYWMWGRPALSHDGRFVAFRAGADNLVPEDTHSSWDVVVRDRATGTTELVTVSSDGALPPGTYTHGTAPPAISADGRYVVFDTGAPLTAKDTNGRFDVYVRDRGANFGVEGLDVRVDAEAIEVSGWVGLAPRIVASVDDAETDASYGNLLGADLKRVAVLQRPEAEDVLVRVSLRTIPGIRGIQVSQVSAGGFGGLPAILYGLDLTVAGVRHEVRAAAPSEWLDAGPAFALFRCAPTCTQVATLTGGVGTTGNDVWISVPMATLGVAQGAEITGVRGFAGRGTVPTGLEFQYDESPAGSGEVPLPSMELAIAPAGTPGDDVSYAQTAAISKGRFTGSVPTSNLPRGPYEVWARSCFGNQCTSVSLPVSLQ